MNKNSASNSAFANLKIPAWAQIAIGLLIVGLVFLMGSKTTRYISGWDEESSNFYQSVTQALTMADINPSAPTVILFWQVDCEPCKRTMQVFRTLPPKVRYYGIHAAEKSNDFMEIRSAWLKHGLRPDAILADSNQMIQLSFSARAVPQTYILLPRQKKIYSYLGDVTKGREEMIKLLQSE